MDLGLLLAHSGTALQTTTSLVSDFYTAFTAFLTTVLLFIPNLIASLLILLIGYLIVRAIVRALNFAFKRSNLDRRISRTDLGQTIERSGRSLTNIVVTTVKWLLYLIVIVYAISALSIAPLTASMLGILGWIPNLIAVIIIVFAGALIASFVGKGIQNTLPKYGVGGGRIIGLAVELIIYAIVFNFALIQIGFAQGILFVITTAMAWGLAAALAIGLGIAIAYALRGVLPPLISGSTTVSGMLKEGHKVTIEGIPTPNGEKQISGRVRSVGMFSTVVENERGGFTVLPNTLLTDKPIMVEGDEAPVPSDKQLQKKANELNEKFEEQSASRESAQPDNQDTSQEAMGR